MWIKYYEPDALSKSHSETISVRNQWFEIFEDLQKEFDRKLNISKNLNKQLEKRALYAEQQSNELKNKVTEQRHQIYALATELEEEKGKNLKLSVSIHNFFYSDILNIYKYNLLL